MNWGRDYLFIAKFGKLVIDEHPEGWNAGAFLNVFDKAGKLVIGPKKTYPIMRSLFQTGRCPKQRAHAIWADHNYDPKKHDQIILKAAKQVLDIAADFPQYKLEFSPFCESDRDLTAILDKCYALIGHKVRIVNSVAKGPIQRNYKNEVHGDHKAPQGDFNYSTDGESCVDENMEGLKKAYGRAEDFYLWHAADNGKLNDADKTPIPNRKSYTTAELNDSIIYLHKPRGRTNLNKVHTWKSHADRHSTPPEPRAYKPVFITPVDARFVELVADNGQIVHTLKRDGNYTDGRPKYRGDEYGYLLSEKARRIQGHSILKLRANGKVIGTVNPAFRDGTYR